MKRAKENIKGSIVLSLENTSSRMSNLAQQLLYHNRFYKLEDILKAVERVTGHDVRNLANRMFNKSCLTLTALGNRGSRNLKSVSLDI